MVGQHRKADVLQRTSEFGGELRLGRRVAVQICREVERRDPRFVVEFVRAAFGQSIDVRLLHLVVAFEVPVGRLPLGQGRPIVIAACHHRSVVGGG